MQRFLPSRRREEFTSIKYTLQASTRSVVCIKEVELANPKPLNESVDDKTEQDEKLEGTGSGFVWDRYGHIVRDFLYS